MCGAHERFRFITAVDIFKTGEGGGLKFVDKKNLLSNHESSFVIIIRVS